MYVKTRSTALSALVAALFLGSALAVVPVRPASAATAACTPQSVPFSVVTAQWGTSTTPMSVYPGAIGVPLTVNMLFSGPCTSPQTTFILNLAQANNPVPFTGSNGDTQPKQVALNLNANSLVTETFTLNVDQSAPTGVTYNIPMVIEYSNNTASDIVTQSLSVSIALYGPVQLSFSAGTTHILAGATDNVTVSVTNAGTAASGTITTSTSLPAGVIQLNSIAPMSSLAAGATSSFVLELFVPSSLSGSAFTVGFTAKYLDAYANSQTTTQSLGFIAGTQTAQSPSSWLVEGAQWGTSASSASPLPGTQDTPLVVNLQYLGSESVTSLQGTIQLPSGVTDLNGKATSTAYSSATTNQYGAVQLTFYLDIASTAKPVTTNYTLTLTWMTSQALGQSEVAVVTPPPLSSLQSSFIMESGTWGTSASASAPVPGTNNEPLVVSLQYVGTTSVTSLKGVLTLPSGLTDVNGERTATAYAAALQPNQVFSLTFYVDVGSAVKPGSYNYSLALSWTTSVGVQLTQNGAVSPAPIAAPATTSTASFPLSISQTNSTVTAGEQTSAAFQLTNQGTSTIYNPSFALQITTPLILASIGTQVPATLLPPGKSTTFDAVVTSSPSATAGIYGGTLSVTFVDVNGTSHTQGFPVSFTLQGTIILILQDTAVSQTVSGFTVTGSILNEGSVPAYYSSVTGLLGTSTATAVYIGEIDPNTPTPFSITIPFTAPATLNTTSSTATTSRTNSSTTSATFTLSRTGTVSRSFTFGGGAGGAGGFPGFNITRGSTAAGSATIVVTLTYKDSFSRDQVTPFTVPTTIKTLGQLSNGQTTTFSTGSTGTSEDQYIAYGVVAAVVVVLVVGALMVRRHRARAFANLTPEQRGEQSVI